MYILHYSHIFTRFSEIAAWKTTHELFKKNHFGVRTITTCKLQLYIFIDNFQVHWNKTKLNPTLTDLQLQLYKLMMTAAIDANVLNGLIIQFTVQK